MRVLITGSTGLVGSALAGVCEEQGDEVLRLVRGSKQSVGGAIAWDPEAGTLDAARLEGLDGIVHLAGENISSGRWTREKKRRIRESRVRGTALLCAKLAELDRPPGVLVSASAIGYYGSRGEEPLDEDSVPGTGFLAEVCKEWEGAVAPAAGVGVRVVRLRIGVVLSADGGALKRMLPPFRLGLGGPLGDGSAHMSWITLDDLVGAIGFCLRTAAIEGPVNALSPHPVTNREFTRALGSVLRRPAVLPAPAVALRLFLGEMADELLLASTRAFPKRLEASGFAFLYPELVPALAHLLR